MYPRATVFPSRPQATKAVISVPACFNMAQCKAIRDAGTQSGLHTMRLTSSTSLAAYACVLKDPEAPERDVLMFGLGGGNLEVSVMTLEEDIVEVKAVRGDARVGGEDFTGRMVEHFLQVRWVISISSSILVRTRNVMIDCVVPSVPMSALSTYSVPVHVMRGLPAIRLDLLRSVRKL